MPGALTRALWVDKKSAKQCGSLRITQELSFQALAGEGDAGKSEGGHFKCTWAHLPQALYKESCRLGRQLIREFGTWEAGRVQEKEHSKEISEISRLSKLSKLSR